MSEFGKVGTVEYAESFIAYFARFAKTEALFEPELAAATAIVGLMRSCTPMDDEIARLLKGVDATSHYDGTGWHGFKGAVRAWLEARK